MMLDFTTSPLHLTLPLSVDTNIDYTLDMTKFPGLNDPVCMQELALLPSTSSASEMEVPRFCTMCGNMLPYNADSTVSCGFCVYYGIEEEDDNVTEIETDELYSLIASCDIDTGYSSVESGQLQSVLEDIIESTSSSYSTTSPLSSSLSSLSSDMTDLLSPLPKLSPLSPLSPSQFTNVISETNSSSICETDLSLSVKEADSVKEFDVTFEDVFSDSTCVPYILDADVLFFSPTVSDTSLRKRKQSTDCDTQPSKRQKTFDMEGLLMNCFGDFARVNSVCSTEKADAISRES